MRKTFISVLCMVALAACSSKAPEQKMAQQAQTQASPSDAQIAQGATLYRRYGCAVCHGKEGYGNGQIARTLNPPPRDFHDISAYKFGHSLETISHTIQKGALNERGMGMPGYPQIPDTERNALAAYIVSLQKTK